VVTYSWLNDYNTSVVIEAEMFSYQV